MFITSFLKFIFKAANRLNLCKDNYALGRGKINGTNISKKSLHLILKIITTKRKTTKVLGLDTEIYLLQNKKSFFVFFNLRLGLKIEKCHNLKLP